MCPAAIPFLSLLGRCLHVAASIVSSALANPDVRSKRMCTERMVTTTVGLASQCDSIGPALRWLSLPGDTGAAVLAGEGAGAKLQQQEEQLLVVVDQFQQAGVEFVYNGELSLESLVAAKKVFEAGLADQLRGLATAMCAAVPCSRFCNNPECCNLLRMSELHRVQGKSCVCAGCGPRVARYCNKACQVNMPGHCVVL